MEPLILSYPPRKSEGQKVFLTKGGGSNYRQFNTGSKFRQQTQASQQRYGKYPFLKQNLFQHDFSSRNKLKTGIRKCLPIDKKVVLFKTSSKRYNSRETKTLLEGLEKINQGSEYPGFSRWLCNTLSKETFSIKDSLISRKQQKLMDKEVKDMLKKRAIRQANTVKREFLSNLFLAEKKDGGKGQQYTLNT